MLNFRNSTVLYTMLVLAIVYVIVLYKSMYGWGYPTYRSNRFHVSRFYWGSHGDYYPDNTNRPGPDGHQKHIGGGPHGGK